MIYYTIKKKESKDTLLSGLKNRDAAYEILDILKRQAPEKFKDYQVYLTKNIEP